MLLEGARLPAATETRRAWLRRAAELTETQLADTAGAIRIWRTLHEEAPADETAREALARLYERERRFADATSLRLAELEATDESGRRLALRLEIVRLSGLLEKEYAPRSCAPTWWNGGTSRRCDGWPRPLARGTKRSWPT